jgi:hypothetical protein
LSDDGDLYNAGFGLFSLFNFDDFLANVTDLHFNS